MKNFISKLLDLDSCDDESGNNSGDESGNNSGDESSNDSDDESNDEKNVSRLNNESVHQ